jgi:hypothetical protein
MYVIFYAPLALSIVGLLFIAFGEYNPIVKILFALLVVASIVLQFTPALQSTIHFLVPLGMQIVAAIWWQIAMKLEEF